jgi:hypothetical protein
MSRYPHGSIDEVSLGLFAGERRVFSCQQSNLRCQVSRGKAMTAKVALLRRSGKRPGAGMGAKGNRVVSHVQMLAPTAAVIPGYPYYSWQRGGKPLGTVRRSGGDNDSAGCLGLRHDRLQPLLMLRVVGSQA